MSAALPSAPYGKDFGTSGYMGVSEPEPGVLLLAYDQLPVGPVGGPGPQHVYAIRVNLTNHKAGAHIQARRIGSPPPTATPATSSEGL